MKIVFATNNVNKLAEVQKMLPHSIQLLTLKDINCFEEIEETEKTLEGNAMLKANYITQHFGYSCFADDTGLEVDSLHGAPGVYSARYAGKENDSEKNMQKLLTELDHKSDRSAQFRTVVALNINNEQLLFEGVCKGRVLTGNSGKKGFGYDPIFKPVGSASSFAEMTSEEKNTISHRGIAIRKLVEFLTNYK